MADEDDPVRQMLRVVQLLDCVPGNAETPRHEPISILTLGHMGEVEQPMLLTIDDSRSLMTKLLRSLTAHGDKNANAAMETYLQQNDPNDSEALAAPESCDMAP